MDLDDQNFRMSIVDHIFRERAEKAYELNQQKMEGQESLQQDDDKDNSQEVRGLCRDVLIEAKVRFWVTVPNEWGKDQIEYFVCTECNDLEMFHELSEYRYVRDTYPVKGSEEVYDKISTYVDYKREFWRKIIDGLKTKPTELPPDAELAENWDEGFYD